MSIYDYKAITIDGDEVSLEQYKGKVLVIVNTASECGFTPQYDGLEKIYELYKGKGFEILGFPSNQFAGQEPGESQEIKNFCSINYGVTFQLFQKGDVRGETAQPLFKYLTEQATFKGFDMNQPDEKGLSEFLLKSYPEFLEGNSIKWNFTKFLVDKEGNVVERYESATEPAIMVTDIDKLVGGYENLVEEFEKINDEEEEIPYIDKQGELNNECDPYDLATTTKLQSM
jgi:glutathione peroxidase